MASRTAAARASTRASAVAAGGPANTRQPPSFAQVCHCAASAPSTRAIAGICAIAAPQSSRLEMAHTAPDALDQFFDLIGFLEGCQREDVGLVLLDILLQVFRKVDQLRRV